MRVTNERTEWLARHVFPHEPTIRLWLKRRATFGLEVDDVIHEMYAKLIALPSVAAIENPRRYAFRIAYTIVVDQIRRTRRQPTTAIDDDYRLALVEPAPSIEEQLSHRSDLQALQATLATLPPLCRQAFWHRRVDGLSQRETAAKLGLSEKTIEKYMTRAVRLIMDQYGRGGKFQSPPSSKATPQPIEHVRKRP